MTARSIGFIWSGYRANKDLTATFSEKAAFMREHYDRDEVRAALHAQAETVAIRLLGAPNRDLSNSCELRWGTKGSLSLNLDSEKRDRNGRSVPVGMWFDYERQSGGDLLDLIEREHGVDFPAALARGAGLVGVKPKANGKGHPPSRLVEAVPDSVPKHIAASPSEARTASATFPLWTKPGSDNRPKFFGRGEEGPQRFADEMRRHLYRRGGVPVRVKIKQKNGGFVDWYRVHNAHDTSGWQARRPADYQAVPYVGVIDPFDDELTGGLIYWPEGEKDCDTLGRINLPALTFGGVGDGLPIGADQYVVGRHVVILSDNDQPGRDHAERKAALCYPVAASVCVVHFPELPEKGDVSDWIAKGHTFEELEARADATPTWHPPQLAAKIDARGASSSSNGATFDAGIVDIPGRPRSSASLIVRRASEVEPEPIDWVWPGRIAVGKHTTIAGDPGVGKSQVMISVAAAVTTGGDFPGGEGRARLGNVIILSAEDGVADTIVPRLMAAGADCGRVTIITGVRLEDGKSTRAFNLQADLELLRNEIRRIGDVALVCIDPISSYLGKVDSHKNAELRSVLEPIGHMAEEERVAVLSVTHLSKGATGAKALYRFIGSIAFTAAPRAAFLVTEDPDDKERRLLLLGKTNLGKAPQGLAFRLVQRLVREPHIIGSYVLWESEPVAMTADQAIAAMNSVVSAERSALDEAVDFLREALACGPRDAKDVEEGADAYCISPRTLRRARKQLGVVLSKKGFDGGWQWHLPTEGGQGLPKVANSKAWPPSADLATFGPAEVDFPDLPASLDRRGA